MNRFIRRPLTFLCLAALIVLVAACSSAATPVRSRRPPLCCENGVDLSLARAGFSRLLQLAVEQPSASSLFNAAWSGLMDGSRAQGVNVDGAQTPQFVRKTSSPSGGVPAATAGPGRAITGGDRISVSGEDTVAEFAPLSASLDRLVAGFRGNLDVARLNYAALDSMAKSIGDSHTQFLSPTLFSRQNKREAGNLGTTTGITLQLAASDAPLVLEVDPGSAAEDAGIKPGDAIVAIDGRASATFGPREAARAIEGDDGTRVALDVRRPGSVRSLRITLVRRTTRRDLVHSTILPGNVGYVRVREFPGAVPINLQLEQALGDFDYAGTNGVIVDLRDNPGGAVNILAAVAGQVISQEPLGFLVERNGIASPVQRTGKFAFNQRLVVLVDEGSASSSELFAAAVQEYGDGSIVGTRTCGCLMGAQFVPLNPNDPPDRQVGLEISLSRVLTPVKHIELEKTGVVPDLQVAPDSHLLSLGRDAQLEAAMMALGVDATTAQTATVNIVRGSQ